MEGQYLPSNFSSNLLSRDLSTVKTDYCLIVLQASETKFLTQIEHSLSMSENRILRRTFGS
jgi:hypothetical protein